MKSEWEAPTHLPTSEACMQFMAPGNLVRVIFQVWLSRTQAAAASPLVLAKQTYDTLWETSSLQQLHAGSTDGHMLTHSCRNTHSHRLGYSHRCLSSSWSKTRWHQSGNENIAYQKYSCRNCQTTPRYKAMALSKGYLSDFEAWKISLSMLPERWEKMFIGTHHKILSST